VDDIKLLHPGLFELDHVEVAVLYTRTTTKSRFVAIFQVGAGFRCFVAGVGCFICWPARCAL
jgi:hypothetical protein